MTVRCSSLPACRAGLRDSIRTTVGYAGIFAAALLALSYAGFNLSNIAIVAGALSVGIGLGLQAVVSNFVSGLILLAERPIKIGDLVTVGGEEGYVRKISVALDRNRDLRARERADPELVVHHGQGEELDASEQHGAASAIAGRCGAWQRSALVKAILLNVAQDHLNVMTSPEPFVDFEDFNADSLNFKLYVYIYDLSKGRRHENRSADWDPGSVQGQRYRPAVGSDRGAGSTRWSGCATRSINI